MHLFPPFLQRCLSLSLLRTYLTVGSSALLRWTSACPLRQRHWRAPIHCHKMRGRSKRAEEGLSEVTHDALWSLLAGVILEERSGTSQTWWYQSPWERKWGLQTLLVKSFAEKLSAKKPEFMIVIMCMKNCFVVLGFFFFLHWLLGGVFCLSVWELLSSSLACGILVPQPGMESSPLHWQHEVFNHWTAG